MNEQRLRRHALTGDLKAVDDVSQLYLRRRDIPSLQEIASVSREAEQITTGKTQALGLIRWFEFRDGKLHVKYGEPTPLVKGNYRSGITDLHDNFPIESDRHLVLTGQTKTGRSYFIKGLITAYHDKVDFIFCHFLRLGANTVINSVRGKPAILVEDSNASYSRGLLNRLSRIDQQRRYQRHRDWRFLWTEHTARASPYRRGYGSLSVTLHSFENLPPSLAQEAYERLGGRQHIFMGGSKLGDIYRIARQETEDGSDR